ncbi:MAG: hypothetical protein LBR12_00835, partial [Opitutaceae bacterium]|nr:hypothetical protein [Opitutaceae bacterium]
AAAKPAPPKPKNPDAKPAKKPAPKPAAAGQPAAAKTDAPKRPFYHAPAATPELREWEELVLEKFDLNKNGRLDRPKEHAALLAAIKAGKFPPPPGGRFHQQPAAKPAGQPAAAAKPAGQPAAAKTDAQNAKPKAVKNADAKPKNADAKAKKNPDAKPKGKRRNAQPKQDPATIPVRVTLGKFIKGVQPTAAVIEPGQTEGELVLRVVDEKLVGSEGVMIIDGTQRWRGGKTISTAPALRYKILPAPPGAEEKPRVPLPPEEKAKIKKAAGKG